jgi:dienelactone hydrolase
MIELRAKLFLSVCWILTAAPVPCMGASLSLPFTLSKPGGDGPFPAVVILHDCSGLGPQSSGAPRRWASDLVRQGYVTVIPDSFTPRGRPTGVCRAGPEQRITFAERSEDAYAALGYLQSLPFVDPRRIAVMGGSHGGTSTLATIVASSENSRRDGPGFAAAVTLYPACGRSFGDWSVVRGDGPGHPITSYSGVFKPKAPLLILIGESDDWTPVEPCRRLADAARAAGYPVDIKTYPGAHHAFDSKAPDTYIPDRRNINAPNGRGATTAGNAEAWADAIQRVHAFLAEHLPGEPSSGEPSPNGHR